MKCILMAAVLASVLPARARAAENVLDLLLSAAPASFDVETRLPQVNGKIPEPKAAAVEGVYKGPSFGNNQYANAPAKPVEWVVIPGGKFTMGNDSGEIGFEDAKPAHGVAIKTFEMSKTVVTVEQYAECVNKGPCLEPPTGNLCNWGKAGRQHHPLNCVHWDLAQAYAEFKGARLPSEAEFEYAATSGGRNQLYPWGNAQATSALVVANLDNTMPVCSKPKGNTAQGLCDMSGNVWQWAQDKYQNSYKGAPNDGSAFEGPGYYRVMRGGGYYNSDAASLRADHRGYGDERADYVFVGIRLVKSSH